VLSLLGTRAAGTDIRRILSLCTKPPAASGVCRAFCSSESKGVTTCRRFQAARRHTGSLQTSIGVVPATGKSVYIQGMDILTYSAGRVTKITVLSDEVGPLSSLEAVTLR
jgi:hypothetical protein